MSTIYTDNGSKSRADYLRHLAEDHGVPFNQVCALASILGPEEDFDGLVCGVEDLAMDALKRDGRIG